MGKKDRLESHPPPNDYFEAVKNSNILLHLIYRIYTIIASK